MMGIFHKFNELNLPLQAFDGIIFKARDDVSILKVFSNFIWIKSNQVPLNERGIGLVNSVDVSKLFPETKRF